MQVVEQKLRPRRDLEHRQVLQQRDNADDDHHDLDDLLYPRVDRQALYQPEDEDDDQEGDENSNEDGHL
jgi:hypothetical protein